MSRSFYVVPNEAPPAGPTIQLGMASLLVRRYLNDDEQSLHGLVLDNHAKDWLEGLRDGRGPLTTDADVLLGELARHGTIRIEVER